jgi:hypothetical protein
MTLYLTDECETCSSIRESLGELAIAHEVVILPSEESEWLPDTADAPVLVDGDKVIQGSTEIFAYIDELREFKRVWLKYQSDVCYLDEDSGEGC